MVCKELTGHGIGRRIHEEPQVPNHYVAQLSQLLTEGLVLTIEPIISAVAVRCAMARSPPTSSTPSCATAVCSC